jgi:hypothetical protein
MDEGGRTDAIVIDFSKAFDLVPHDRLLTKISETGVEWRVVNWIKNFLSGRSQRVKIETGCVCYLYCINTATGWTTHLQYNDDNNHDNDIYIYIYMYMLLTRGTSLSAPTTVFSIRQYLRKYKENVSRSSTSDDNQNRHTGYLVHTGHYHLHKVRHTSYDLP